MKRREFLSRGTRLSLSVGVGLLAACTSTSPPSTAPTTAPAAAPTQPAAPTTAPAAPAATSAPAAAQPTSAPAAAAKPASAGGTLSKLPTFAQPPMPTPELPGSGDGLVDPGYLNYPKQLIQAVKQTPGTGGPVNLWFWIGTAPVPPMDQNPPWLEVNKAVNATLNISFIPFADFNVRWSTLQSGNDMPDITVAFTRPDTAILPAFLDARCADLTPYLSADAVNEYPNLAGLPTRSWKSALINGKLYGVPVPLRPYFWWFWTHQEILDRDGLSQPKSAAEFKQQAVQLTNPQAGVWAIAGEGGAQYAFNTVSGLWSAVYGAPNYWAVDSAGKFTSAFESEQFKQCVVYATDLVKSGAYDPNTLSYNTLSARTQFMGRRAIYRFDGLPHGAILGRDQRARHGSALEYQTRGAVLGRRYNQTPVLLWPAELQSRPHQEVARAARARAAADSGLVRLAVWQSGVPPEDVRHRRSRLQLQRDGQSDRH